MKKILSLIALAAAALAGLAPTPLYVGRFAGDGTYISNVTAVALTTNTIHLQSSPSIGITTNSSTLNTPYLDSSVTNAWKLDGTNAAMGVVTYSNLPAAHLTGSLPAIDGSALTGIGIGTNVAVTTNGAVAGYDHSANYGLATALRDKLMANSNVFKVFMVGDSLGYPGMGYLGIPAQLGVELAQQYGYAGSAIRTVGSFGTNNPASALASSAGTNAATMEQSGGTNWFNFWHVAPVGAAVMWTNGTANGSTADKLALYWVKTPGGGDFTFQISTNGGAWADVAACSGYAAANTGGFTNLTVARNAYRLRAWSVTGTNVFIGPEWIDSTTKGVVIGTMDLGGSTFANVSNVTEAVRFSVLTNFAPDLIVFNMAERTLVTDDYMRAHFQTTFSNWFAAANCPVIACGMWHYGNANAAYTYAENHLYREAALSNSWIFPDFAYAGGSFEAQVKNGYMELGSVETVHLSVTGSRHFAGWLMTGLGLNGLRPGTNAATYWSANSSGGISNSTAGPITLNLYGADHGHLKLNNGETTFLQLFAYDPLVPAGYGLTCANSNAFFWGNYAYSIFNAPQVHGGPFFEQAGQARAYFNSSGGLVVGAYNAGLTNTAGTVVADSFTGTHTGVSQPPVKAAFSTNYTATVADAVLFCVGTNQLITLPNCTNAGTPAGCMLTVAVTSTTGSAIVTNANGVQKINNALSVTNGAAGTTTNRLTLVSDGANWW